MLCCDEATLSWNFERHNFLWISKPFSVEENSNNDDVAAKTEFLQLQKNARPKTDLTRKDIGKFWADIDI